MLCPGREKWLTSSAAPTVLPSSGGQDPTLHPPFHGQNPVWMRTATVRTPTCAPCQSTGTLLCLGSKTSCYKQHKHFSRALGGSNDSGVSLGGAGSPGRQLLVPGAESRQLMECGFLSRGGFPVGGADNSCCWMLISRLIPLPWRYNDLVLQRKVSGNW